MNDSIRPVIDGETRLVGLLGDPVAHSLSPALHNAAFAHLDLNMVYVPLPVTPAALAAALAGLPALGFVGANVTVPHKAAAAALVDDLHGDARLLGAVNTLVVRGRRLEGHNTDVDGFVQAFREAAPDEPAGDVLLLGAGGAARAAALGALRLGCRRLTVVDRTLAAADALCGLVRRLQPDVPCDALDLADLGPEHVGAAHLVVNATTLGMSDESKVPSALADNVGVDQIVYDLVYGPAPTDLVRRAAAHGARSVEGLAMLVWQAAAAFQLWTGMPAPVDVMRRAITG